MGASSDILYPATKQQEAAAHIIAGGILETRNFLHLLHIFHNKIVLSLKCSFQK